MRLEALGLQGVKGFATEQRLDLADVNLIYGTNSSGKSTVLQTLLLLQQSATRAFSAERGYLEFRGGSVDLGGYRTFVNMHDTRSAISVGLGLSNIQLRSTLNLGTEITLELQFSLPSPSSSEPDLTQIEFEVGRANVIFKRQDDGALRLNDTNSATVLVDAYFAALSSVESRVRRQVLPKPAEGDRRWLRDWLRRQDCQTHGWLPLWPMSTVAGRRGRPIGGKKDSPRNQLAQYFVAWWQDYIYEFGFDLYQTLTDLVYVGPLREFPRRVVAEATDGIGVGVRGERLVLHLARHPELVQKVNRAFKDLDIPYDLAVDTVAAGRIEDALGDVAVAVLIDKRSGVVVSPADVGFGLSQVLPVVVQLIGNENRTILMEQPEIHLHPRVQSKLADIILRSVRDNGNRVIIETHSEHILIRVERRLGEMAAPVPPTALAVYYVSSRTGPSEITRMRTDESGRLIDPWPDGFFDEKLEDLLA